MPSTHQGNGDPSSALPARPRVKHTRSHSPVASSSSLPSETRPHPPKRARKAINCEPCRNSKLKCDRNRPCSSCILRGTTSLCYQGQEPDPAVRHDDQQTRGDPGIEFSRIRYSLSQLESYIYQNPSLRTAPPLPVTTAPSAALAARNSAPEDYGDLSRDAGDVDSSLSPHKDKMASAPGMLGQQGSGGFYSGPTSALSHLISATDREENDVCEGHPPPSDRGLPDGGPASSSAASSATTPSRAFSQVPSTYDDDLVALLPPVHTVDALVEYYFEYCNWIYRHVNQPALLAGWARFKSGASGDRVVLGTVCIVIALAARYLPGGHPLLASLHETCEEVGDKYYEVMLEALSRHRQAMRKEGQGKGYTLDLVELLLVRSHYLTFAKEDPEETWRVRGELISMGTAMGLHRDPGKARFEGSVAERRRWAWWHIILFERWQAFMFGRPISIASHHFNTRLPSYCDPALDNTGRLYLPNIALFRLAYALGDIMEDAVSFRAVPYTAIQAHDKLLTRWLESLPTELDLDEYRVARSLASPITSVRRLGVQSVIIRTAYHHIRFTLHRPYASIPASLEVAVSAASQLIALVGQTRPDFLSNTALAVPGHMNWGPFHIFSAAMFFSFQLISHPDQPAASLFRENIRKTIICLEQSRWMPVADKALTILQALAPLYSDEFTSEPPEEREREKAQVLNLVKTLAFPYQDSPYSRSAESPATRRSDSDSPVALTQGHYDPVLSQAEPINSHTQLPVSSIRWAPTHPNLPPMTTFDHSPTRQLALLTGVSSTGTHQSLEPNENHQSSSIATQGSTFPNMSRGVQGSFQQSMQLGGGMDNVLGQNVMAYIHPADESSMWGASVGFGLGEWSQFLSTMQRPDNGVRGAQA